MIDKTVLCCWIALTIFSLAPLTAQSASGQQLPDVSFPNIDGQTQSIRQWQGKKLLVNFWATWCAPCRKEMPDLASLQTELQAQGLQVIGIAIDDAKSVRQYLQQNPVNYPILLAPDVGTLLSAELGNRMGVLPFSAFVGKDGIVEFTHTGLITKEMVKSWVRNSTVKSP